MRVLILFSLLFPLAAGPLAKAVSARVEPMLGTWLMTGAALLLAGTSCGALGLLVLSPLVKMTWVANLGHWSSSIVAGAGLPGGWTSLIAAVALGAALLATVAFAVRRGRAMTYAWQHARSLPGHGELVVTEDSAADAYAVPGWPGRIVVSEGMLGALDDRGRAALLAHERAHLANHHHWFTAVARLAAAANPLVRPLASAVEYSVERWADEAAAAELGDRHLVARAIANAAIAAKATKAKSAMAGALGAIGSGIGSEICARVTSRRLRIDQQATENSESASADRSRATGQQREIGRRQAEDSASGSGNGARATRQRRSIGRRQTTAGSASSSGGGLRMAGRRRGFGWLGLVGGDDRLAGAGPVPRRVAALLGPAPSSRNGLPTLAASLVFLGVVAMCALVAADHLQDLLSFAHATVDRSM